MKQILRNQAQREAFIGDCVLIIENQVKSQNGISGLAINNAYRMLNKLTPGATWQATEILVDDFAEKIEPYLREFTQKYSDYQQLPNFLESKAEIIAESFLQVTDAKVHQFDSSVLLTFYKTLRPFARKHVERAVPDIAFVLCKYLVTPAGIEPASAT